MKFNNAMNLLLVCTVCAIFTGCAGRQSNSCAVPEPQAPSVQSAVSENTTAPAPASTSGQVDMTIMRSAEGNVPNLECFPISEIVDGALAGQKDEFGYEWYDIDMLRTAIEEGRVLEGIGSSFNTFGIDFTLEDTWYETSTANMQENF